MPYDKTDHNMIFVCRVWILNSFFKNDNNCGRAILNSLGSMVHIEDMVTLHAALIFRAHIPDLENIPMTFVFIRMWGIYFCTHQTHREHLWVLLAS